MSIKNVLTLNIRESVQEILRSFKFCEDDFCEVPSKKKWSKEGIVKRFLSKKRANYMCCMYDLINKSWYSMFFTDAGQKADISSVGPLSVPNTWHLKFHPSNQPCGKKHFTSTFFIIPTFDILADAGKPGFFSTNESSNIMYISSRYASNIYGFTI